MYPYRQKASVKGQRPKPAAQEIKSFLLLFFKKEVLALQRPEARQRRLWRDVVKHNLNGQADPQSGVRRIDEVAREPHTLIEFDLHGVIGQVGREGG
jgi:hypothetical protein